jgi:acyl-CoA thioester hydrolase
MSRVKLDEQSAYEYSHSLMVRATDLNYAGHLGNEALLALVHEARAHYLHILNFNTIMGHGQTVGLAIVDLIVNFKAEAFAHEYLTVDCHIDEITQKSFRLFHRIRCSNQVIALVETGLVAFDYAIRQTVPLPPEFLLGLDMYRAGSEKPNERGEVQ